MEGFLVDHDFRALNAFVVAEFACQFDSRFVGLQPGGAKKHIAHARKFHQLGGELLLQGHVVIVATVDDFGQLVLQRPNQIRVVVAEGIDCDAAQGIQVFAPIDIPHPAALSVGYRHGQSSVRVHHVRGRWGGGAHRTAHGGCSR